MSHAVHFPDNWRCRIGWHNWLNIFQTGPWTSYRGCVRCQNFKESFPNGLSALSTSWHWVSKKYVESELVEWLAACTASRLGEKRCR